MIGLNFFQTIIIAQLSVILMLIILLPGFLAIQHENVVVRQGQNVANITQQISQHGKDMETNIDMIMGIETRIHNDVEQLLPRSNDECWILNFIPNDFPH